ncbi:MAG: 4-hydroxyphenylpyruvate dioxygenase [Candidatus Nitronauta litoralis]|uniref:4-hydroxyphenylpyruvate dioxygenase n=1 Tax=Candidatus Nitronauta litoralis TaxID=2705533 RepID=A0A7T0BV53_9BACT|nr:MAG: 4-hydroxyphenylpyruvate dioxygenase [Candidatus Nitronauta litoralis]
METESSPGIVKVHSIEFVVEYIDRSREFYVNKLGFHESHRSTPEWEHEFNSKGIIFSSNDIKVLVSAPLSSHSYSADFLKLLSPGIRKVNLQVESLQRALDFLGAHDATFIHDPKEIHSANCCHRMTSIATPIGFLEIGFIEIDGDENEIPMFQSCRIEKGLSAPFQRIDHMTINTRTIFPICSFFEHVLNLKEFWRVAFHTPDSSSGEHGTGLSSRVMWDPVSKLKFAVNEPLHPHFNDSQIQTFIEKNHGSGIQHVALSVPDLIDSVHSLRLQGIEFLETPDAYYDLLPERMRKNQISSIRENLEDLRKERILLDGQNENYLLQIFLKEASQLYHEDDAGPFFYEIIQREGHDGFGEGNFRALFEAIEFQEVQS